MPNPTPPPTRALCRALILLVAALCLAPAAASAAPAYGVQGVDALPWVSVAATNKQLDEAQATHAKVLRLEVAWSLIEPVAAGQRDPAALAAIDRAVAGASARGMKVLLLVDSTPCWASTSPKRGTCSGADANNHEVTRYQPSSPQGYADFSAFLAQRYAKDLAAFEIWNEPDQSNEQYWAGPNKVVNYVALAKAAYPAIKKVAPNVPVLAGSFVGGNGKWLQALYKAGIKGSYDALSVHFYDLTLSALTTTRAVQKANGDKSPLWLGEFGFTSCFRKGAPAFMVDHACNTRAGQAQNLVDTLRSIQKVSWVKGAVVFTLRDQSEAYQFGLYTRTGAHKPAFTSVRSVFSGKKLAVTKPTMRLTAKRGRVTASGRASQVEIFRMDVYRSGRLTYRANLRTDRFGVYKLRLPAVLGTSHLRVRLTGVWTGSVQKRR